MSWMSGRVGELARGGESWAGVGQAVRADGGRGGGAHWSKRDGGESDSSLLRPNRVVLAAMAPTTVIARWTRCNTQSAVPALAAAINKAQQGVTATGRWTVQARSFRLPSSSTTAPKGTVTSRVGGLSNEKEADDGRSMVVVRASTSEVGYTFIEDPAAPLRAAQGAAPHTRTTTSTLSATAPSFPFDMLLGRVLCLPPNAGTPGVGAWIPRTSHLLIDGYAFTVGQTGAVAGDWVVRIGGVQIKGGAAGGRGCVVEVRHSARCVKLT